MAQPFNYSLDTINPAEAIQRGMAFGQQQRMGEQNMALADAAEGRARTQFAQQNMLFDQAQADRAAGLEAARAQQADLVELAGRVSAGNYSAQDFAALTLKHPALGDQLAGMWQGLSAERKAADVANIYKGVMAMKAGRPDVAVQMLEDRATAAENSGDQMEADTARAMAAAINADPAAGLTTLGLLLQSVDPEAATAVFGAGKRVQSTNAYANGTTVTVFSDGSKEVTDAAGNVMAGAEAQAAVDAAVASEAAMRGANAAAASSGKLKTEADLVGGVEAEKKAAANNQDIVQKAQAALGTISSTIRNYDDALAALDAGAQTGVVAAKMPALTNAGALLENAKLRLGLDVIASVTFGALSEGERNAAMQTALPTNLDGPELRQWIATRQEAERKLAAVQKAAVEHFSRNDLSQRALAEEWVKKYSATIPGVQGAFDAQFGAGGGAAADGLTEDDLKYLEGP